MVGYPPSLYVYVCSASHWNNDIPHKLPNFPLKFSLDSVISVFFAALRLTFQGCNHNWIVSNLAWNRFGIFQIRFWLKCKPILWQSLLQIPAKKCSLLKRNSLVKTFLCYVNRTEWTRYHWRPIVYIEKQTLYLADELSNAFKYCITLARIQSKNLALA